MFRCFRKLFGKMPEYPSSEQFKDIVMTRGVDVAVKYTAKIMAVRIKIYNKRMDILLYLSIIFLLLAVFAPELIYLIRRL